MQTRGPLFPDPEKLLYPKGRLDLFLQTRRASGPGRGQEAGTGRMMLPTRRPWTAGTAALSSACPAADNDGCRSPAPRRGDPRGTGH